MIDILDLFHYLIGIIIVTLLLWIIIQIHNHFSKNNKPIKVIDTSTGDNETDGKYNRKKK